MLAPIFLFLSLVLLRQQPVLDLKLNWSQAWSLGLWSGWLYDGVLVLFLFGIKNLSRKLPKNLGAAVWVPLFLFAWLSALANILYFRFFGMRLDWWIIQLHWRDLAVVQGSAINLSGAPFIVASFVCFLFSLGATLLRSKKSGIALLLAALLIYSIPHWMREFRQSSLGSNLLSDQILRVWLKQNMADAYDSVGKGRSSAIARDLADPSTQNPGEILATYRDGGLSAEGLKPFKPDWPLLKQFETSRAETERLRNRLGLPLEGKLNIIILFVESFRAFDLGHPKIGPLIFPEVRNVIAKKGVWFTQAYSSVFEAGETVQGQFSTLCSALPNMGGPAVYITQPTLKIRCLPALFKENGYRTAWFNSASKNYHNKFAFESLHGMDEFYDEEYFKKMGVTQKIGEWGLADAPFLNETLKRLEAMDKEGKPIFAHILTMSTHHPHSVIPEGKIPPPLDGEVKDQPAYEAYLSRCKYADEAVGNFLEQFLESPLADHTLLVLMGDHGIFVDPHLPLTAVQKREVPFRIPVVLFSKNLGHPERIEHPVHQADVAPTLAQIAGISGEVTWLGRGLFAKEGLPWLILGSDSQLFSYRTASQACYRFPTETKMKCWNVKGKDPLFDFSLPESTENFSQTNFFRSVAKANRQALLLNRIAP